MVLLRPAQRRCPGPPGCRLRAVGQARNRFQCPIRRANERLQRGASGRSATHPVAVDAQLKPASACSRWSITAPGSTPRATSGEANVCWSVWGVRPSGSGTSPARSSRWSARSGGGCENGAVLLKLAGSICSGKTTAAHACADIDGLVVHDFDEVGVPVDASRVWRQRTTEAWIRRVIAYQERGLDVLLTGQSPLGEVLACPSAPQLDGIAACLLDVADGERLRRLDNRDPRRWDRQARRAFIGWARWHRAHAKDPRWHQEVITEGGWEQMQWARWTAWTQHDSRWHTAIIDTTQRSIDQSASDVRRWITDARS